MKRLGLAAALSLAALPVWAQHIEIAPGDDIRTVILMTGANNIAVGNHSDIEPPGSTCAIADGDGVVAHGSYSLAVAGQPERRVWFIGPTLIAKLEAETKRLMASEPSVGDNVPPAFSWRRVAAHWNAACGRMVRR